MRRRGLLLLCSLGVWMLSAAPALAQLIDATQAPNALNEGIHKSLTQEAGVGRGDVLTPDSSLFIIGRDPFRAVRRGRQLFQRKFRVAQGQGPGVGDGVGNLNDPNLFSIGSGLADSCALCHSRPRGSAGVGGSNANKPDSRDAPHLFGVGLKEQLADEITSDLRSIRTQAINQAAATHQPVTKTLTSKGISYGSITASANGSVDTSAVEGVNPDLRVRPLGLDGRSFSLREFITPVLHTVMGIEINDPDLANAHAGMRVVTPAGLVLDGSKDSVQAQVNAPYDNLGVTPGTEVALVDYLEFYLLHYFKPATYEETHFSEQGRKVFEKVGCARCHIPDLQLNRDRRVADVETVFDPVRGIFNRLFATATPQFTATNDGSGFPTLKVPNGGAFLVKDIFTDFKRHDLGPNFWERNYNSPTNITKQFLTTALWGVGTTGPYGHDGRSINLTEAILRHGGEAQAERDAFAELPDHLQGSLLDFLNHLIIFPPDDTASNLDPGNRAAANFPQNGHGSIKLSVLFDPLDPTTGAE
jgi:hypothetical protein